MSRFIIISFTLFLIACTPQNKNINNSNEQKADTIFITYFQHSVDSDVAITCDEIALIQKDHPENDYDSYLKYGILPLVVDTFIVNFKCIEKIDSLLQQKEKTEVFRDDKRMLVSIKRYNGMIDELCIGHFSAPKVYYNNEPYIINDELIFILRYGSGYYRWNDPNLFEELNNRKEMKKELEEQWMKDEIFKNEREKIQ